MKYKSQKNYKKDYDVLFFQRILAVQNNNIMKAQVFQFLTRDPKNKRGEIGTIIKIDEADETYTLLFEDGVIGLYSFDAVELL